MALEGAAMLAIGKQGRARQMAGTRAGTAGM
jgi:hypothetical protein